MSHPKYLTQKSNFGFQDRNTHKAGERSIRAHIQTKSGDTWFVGRVLSKDKDTHEVIILPDGAKETIKINLGNYVARSSALMPNTVYYRRVD
jgi:hypothetical protein